MKFRLSLVCLSLPLAVPLAAQEPGPVPTGVGIDPGQPVPIHTSVDDPVGGAYGTWGAGAGFKVRFDAGRLELHLHDADAPEPPVLRWHTAAILVGGEDVRKSDAVIRHTDWRFETDHGAVVERYDLWGGGVEQSFLVRERPGRPGEIVVRGRVDAPWSAALRGPEHAPVTFADGTDGFEYGVAYAVDAVGRRTPLKTAWDGEHIELRVPADLVATASFPLLIDPPITPTTFHSSRDRITSIDVARDDDTNTLWATVTTRVSLRDDDLRFYRLDDDAGNGSLVYADITTSWSTESATVATVGGPREAIATFHRAFSSGARAVRWHAHNFNDLTASTAYGVMPGAVGGHDSNPDVGGMRAFQSGTNYAAIVFERDLSGSVWVDTADTRACYVLVDLSASGQGRVSTVGLLRGVGTGIDQARPRISLMSAGGSDAQWAVAWQEYGVRRSNELAWDGVVKQLRPGTGSGVVSSSFHRAQGSRGSTRVQCIRPEVAGEGGRYLLTYGESRTSLVAGKTSFPETHALVSERLDWAPGGSPQARDVVRRRESTQRRFVSGGVAHDSDTASHWLGSYVDTIDNQARYDKFGFSGRITESANLDFSAGVDPVVGGVSFDDDNDRYVAASARYYGPTLTWRGVVSHVGYTAVGAPGVFALNCSSARQSWIGTTRVGDYFAGVALRSAPAGQPAFLLIATLRGYTSLSSIGAYGCNLLLDLNQVAPVATALPTTINAAGEARITLPLVEGLNTPVLFTQWIILDPRPNPAGLIATEGLRVPITR
jgi:hypothetical protein